MLTYVHETVGIDYCGMLSESPLIPINSRMRPLIRTEGFKLVSRDSPENFCPYATLLTSHMIYFLPPRNLYFFS